MASSSSSAQVSYVELYKGWMKANRKLNRNSTIPLEVLLTGLRFSDVLSKFEHQLVGAIKTDDEKLLKLFTEIMPDKGEQGFNQVVEILKENKNIELAKDLIGGLNRECSTNKPNSTFPVQNPRIIQAQAHLSRLIQKNVDFMSKYWSDVIRVAKTEAAFVQVQVLEHFKSENGNPVNSYREVFNKDGNKIHPRILIQADPGCGKTTYVNKLALDWANEDEYLRDKFDFVFLIPLQTLTMDVLDAIKWFLPDESEQFFASYANSLDSKILLILDGFDELVENSEWYSSVMDILNDKSKQFQFFHIIVTTRRSHVDKIPKQFRERSLLIEGFDKESMKQFLIKQHVPLPSVGQRSNLSRLLQTPLFCAIYCSLHVGGGDPIELEDSYDLIKPLVENSVTKTVKNKTVANVEELKELNEQLDEVGKFAFQMLDSESVNFLMMFCRSSEVVKPSFDLSRVNLDLLIKRRIPARGVGGFKEEFSLHHQLLAEYLAARYYAGSLTEQLKQADASALLPDLTYHVLNLPFVRFFLFELFFLYLKKKYEESVFDSFLILPVLRFIWNCKSNNDIPKLDNVSDLDFYRWNSELTNVSRFIPTLSKCQNLSSLMLWRCGLLKNQVKQLVSFINKNCFQKLVGLDLGGNANVGSSTELFRALHKCPQLQVLNLSRCSMTQESLNIFMSTFNSNTFQEMYYIWLLGNRDIEVDDNFFIALEKCPKIFVVDVGYRQYMKSDVQHVAQTPQLQTTWKRLLEFIQTVQKRLQEGLPVTIQEVDIEGQYIKLGNINSDKIDINMNGWTLRKTITGGIPISFTFGPIKLPYGEIVTIRADNPPRGQFKIDGSVYERLDSWGSGINYDTALFNDEGVGVASDHRSNRSKSIVEFEQPVKK